MCGDLDWIKLARDVINGWLLWTRQWIFGLHKKNGEFSCLDKSGRQWSMRLLKSCCGDLVRRTKLQNSFATTVSDLQQSLIIPVKISLVLFICLSLTHYSVVSIAYDNCTTSCKFHVLFLPHKGTFLRVLLNIFAMFWTIHMGMSVGQDFSVFPVRTTHYMRWCDLLPLVFLFVKCN